MLEQPLEGSNLIEASAGTGKTYSVALLFLRLVIEKGITANRILTVTFTKAAAAEMAARIRFFLMLALGKAWGEEIDNSDIAAIVQKHLRNNSSSELEGRLNQALVQLDEASIQTIHSFCQESLATFAFETGQAYGLELKEDLSGIVSAYVDEFWRNDITGLAQEAFEEWEGQLKVDFFRGLVKNIFGGKEYFFPEAQTMTPEQYLAEKRQFERHLSENKRDYTGKIKSVVIPRFTDKPKEKVIEMLDNPQEFSAWRRKVQKDNKPAYAIELFQQVFSELVDMDRRLEVSHENVVHHLAWKCINYVRVQIVRHLQENHLLTYDDMIGKLHKAVMADDNESLRDQLSKKYDAVFIDEFQDTDKLQYEIYDKLYGDDKILFYIGDPKQSIFGWRKADLNVYFRAAEKVGQDNQYTMRTNYRSSWNYVEAMNHFFGGETDHFLTGTHETQQVESGDPQRQRIKYIKVKSAQKESRPGLENHLSGNPIKPLEIFIAENQDEIKDRFIELVKAILGGLVNLNGVPVKPSDIGVLVRKNEEGTDFKKRLAREGVKAVTVDDANVFKSAEAEELLHVLESVLDITWKGVNKALFNSFTGLTPEKLITKDDNLLIDRFKHYQQVWIQDGVFKMMREYMQDFAVVANLTDIKNGLGLRHLTNLNQLLELLQEAEFRNELNPSGLLAYMQRKREEADENTAVYAQRIESDEDAITIATIHKAKGLQYPVVIAPFMDLTVQTSHTFLSYRNNIGNYLFFPSGFGSGESEAFHSTQIQQENRRLLYVAITRAQYNCFIFRSIGGRDSTLSDYVEYLKAHPGEHACLREQPSKKPGEDGTDIKHWPQVVLERMKEGPRVTREAQAMEATDQNQVQKEISAEGFSLPDKNWWKLSFSALTLKRQGPPKPRDAELTSAYDTFVFRTLPKGASMGDLLHYIFERIDFREAGEREEIVKAGLQRYFPNLAEELYEPLLEHINQVTGATIQVDGTSFTLRDVDSAKKVSELEFDIPVSRLSAGELAEMPVSDGVEVLAKDLNDVQGLLNGFVDLFFEHGGKYYVLDWKSNYLGDKLEDYQGDGLLEAMNSNNYHLQYLLYTFAIDKFLNRKVEGYEYEKHFGGVIYLFLRGARQGESSGIYIARPEIGQLKHIGNCIK